MNFFYIIGTIILSVYGQLILKWRIAQYGHMPSGLTDKFIFFGKLILDPFIISAFAAGFPATLFWMAAMTKFDLSFAYPFTSLSFVLILIFSALFLEEPVTFPKIIGMTLIVSGIIVGSRA